MKATLRDNQGIALVVVIAIVGILLAITGGVLLFSGLGLKTASNLRTGIAALHAAEYALQHALAVIPWGLEFDDVLGGTGGFPCANPCNGVLNKPTLTGSIGNYSYTVIAANDPADNASPTNDTNQIAVLTATATGPNGAKKIVEAYVGRPNSTWQPRGAVYLGATSGTSGFSGSSFKINGKDTNPGGAGGSGPLSAVPGIATPGSTRQSNDTGSLGSGKYSLVDGLGGSAPSIELASSFNVSQLATDLLNLYPADKIAVCPGNYTNSTWGTEAAPKIVYFPGAPDCPDGTTNVTGGAGYGVLILDRDDNMNDLHVGGTFEWKGIIITRGGGTGLGGHIHFDPSHFGASGGAQVWGAVMNEQSQSFDIGGTSKVYYSSQAIKTVVGRWGTAFPRPAGILSWKEVM